MAETRRPPHPAAPALAGLLLALLGTALGLSADGAWLVVLASGASLVVAAALVACSISWSRR